MEKLVCTICHPGYYLNNDGKCINYLNYMERIQNCIGYSYTFNNITYFAYDYFYDHPYSYSYSNSYFCTYKEQNHYDDYYNDEYNSYNYIKSYIGKTDLNVPIINSTFKAKCIKCNSKYYLNSEGECIEISDEDCSLVSIVFDITQKRLIMCNNFCNNYENDKIYYEINYYNTIEGKNEIFNPIDLLNNIYYDYNYYITDIFYYLNDDLKPIFLENKLCVDRPKNFANFRECTKFQYDASTDTYKCIECNNYNHYYLDTQSNSCIYIKDKHIFDDNYNCVA